MWVRTTEQRIGRCEKYLPEQLWAELCIERVPVRAQVDVRAPAIAWLRIRDHLYEVIFNSRGQLSFRVPETLFTMVEHISQTLGDLERHAALKGLGREGRHTECLYVWPQMMDRQQRIFSPYPNDGEFTVLKPHWNTYLGRKVTTWDVKGHSPHGDRLAEESAHLRCL